MIRSILLAVFFASFSCAALAQTADKPKAQLFDEFKVTTNDELITRTTLFRNRLVKQDWKAVYIFVFYASKKPGYIRTLVTETLYKNCYDCFGYSPLITFVDIDDSDDRVQFWIVPPYADPPTPRRKKDHPANRYPAVWFAPIDDPKKPGWEILPQEAKAGEVILSKRNELGILSNFAATPFELDGKRYGSVEGFWQMMLYPEMRADDLRYRESAVQWKYSREQVAQMTAFEAKSAGTLAEENMKKLGIDWCTYQGKRFPYRSATPGEHYRLIVAAMRAKLEQNPEVRRILLATGDLSLKPDHHGEENPPPEWKYYEIWMQLRSELQKPAR